MESTSHISDCPACQERPSLASQWAANKRKRSTVCPSGLKPLGVSAGHGGIRRGVITTPADVAAMSAADNAVIVAQATGRARFASFFRALLSPKEVKHVDEGSFVGALKAGSNPARSTVSWARHEVLASRSVLARLSCQAARPTGRHPAPFLTYTGPGVGQIGILPIPGASGGKAERTRRDPKALIRSMTLDLLCKIRGTVAQLVERRLCNPMAASSILASSTL